MRIAFAGTHGTGKTTLVDELTNIEPFKSDYYHDLNVTRWVKSLGFEINENTSSTGQTFNMMKRTLTLIENENMIADRSLFDIMAYSIYGMIDKELMDFQKKLVKKHSDLYDVIFYLPPEIPLVLDGTRSPDENFRDVIDLYILGMLSELPKEKVFTLNGSVEERLEKIKEILHL